jgi:hypothetical protein
MARLRDEPHRRRRYRETRAEVRGFVGLVLAFAALWLGHTAAETWNAACPPGVTISDINHGAGGPACGRSMFYWFCAAAALVASAWAILVWLVMWIVSLLTVVRK